MTDLATNVLYYGDNLDILRRYLPDDVPSTWSTSTRRSTRTARTGSSFFRIRAHRESTQQQALAEPPPRPPPPEPARS